MKTTHLFALTATIVACTAATASARPADDPPGSQASKPAAVSSASIAAHREQISTQQWQRSQNQPAPTPQSAGSRSFSCCSASPFRSGSRSSSVGRSWATPGTGTTRRPPPDHSAPTGPGGF